MRVLIHPADEHGCGFYRLIAAAVFLQSQGHDVHIAYPHEKQNGMNVMLEDQPDGSTKMIDFALSLEGVDVLVMQRISHHLHLQAVPLVRQKGIAVVVDMDDDLTTINPGNQAFWNYRTGSSTPFSGRNAIQVCKDATLVTVSTRNLLRVYAKHGRGAVLDNYVPERYLWINPMFHDGPPVFGWGGTLKSHPTDLQVVGRAVREIVDEGYPFKVVGPGESGIARQLKLDSVVGSGIVDMYNWPIALADNLDVGMAPLEASTFNSAKSRLKLLEYAAVGIPCVASPREEYRRFHQESKGAVILADTPKQWAAGLRSLLSDDTRRKEMGQQAQAYAAEQTVEKNAWRWWEAWTRAHEIQQGKRDR